MTRLKCNQVNISIFFITITQISLILRDSISLLGRSEQKNKNKNSTESLEGTQGNLANSNWKNKFNVAHVSTASSEENWRHKLLLIKTFLIETSTYLYTTHCTIILFYLYQQLALSVHIDNANLLTNLN